MRLVSCSRDLLTWSVGQPLCSAISGHFELFRATCLIAAFSFFLLQAIAEGEEATKTPYRIVDGRVDKSTYMGWRAYHTACHGCHGVDASGTTIAPDLTARMQKLNAREFSTKVLTSYRIIVGHDDDTFGDEAATSDVALGRVLERKSGELLMPAWEGDPNVTAHLLDVYAYLKARADGVLGPGRPEPLGE